MRKEEFYEIVPKDEVGRIVKDIELPAFIYFKRIVKRKYDELLDCLPKGFEIHYAFKANPNQEVLEFIRSLGAGADVASLGELRLAMEIGIPKEKIEFTGPGKTIEELSLAIDLGISSINVESISEINIILDLCRAKGKPANLGIRLNPNAKSSPSAMKMSGDSQFGIIENDLPFLRMRADAGAQAGDAEGLRVAHRTALGQGAGGGLGGALRRAGAGLADLHADDMRRARRQGSLADVGRRDHVHDDEGRRGGTLPRLDPGMARARHQLLPAARPKPRGSVAQAHVRSESGR